MTRQARPNCRGSGKPPAAPGQGPSPEWGVCRACHRDVRIKADGTVFAHKAKAPTDRSDPRHDKRLRDTYGITGEQYEAILAHQGGVCAICRRRPRSKRLAVDHDHNTGAVRGLLCKKCNHDLLGSAHDATPLLVRALAYLTDPPARAVLGEEG